MRNRWYHRPLLHSPVLAEPKKPTWLELFYDLIFVAAFIQLGNGLSEHVSAEGYVAFAGMFIPLWVSWTGFTFYENRFTVDDFTHRAIVLAQMFAVGGMAISAPQVLEGETVAFSFSAAVSLFMVCAMYLRALPQVTESREYSVYWAVAFGGGALVFAGSAFLPPPLCYIGWGIASVGIIVASLLKRSRALAEQWPLDFEHLAERYGLLTIIVLGESFVKVLSSLADEGAGVELWVQAAISLAITVCVWWVYFDDVAGSHLKKGRGLWLIWLYAHIPLQVSVTAVGVAVKKAVEFSMDDPAPAKYRWLLAGSLALVFVSVAIIDSVVERRQVELSDRTRIIVRSASAALLLVLVPAGGGMPGAVFLALITAVCVAQVVFDMVSAPFEAAEHIEIGQRSTAEVARKVAAGEHVERRPRREVSDAVRKGTPAALGRDFYFYFMEGSWTRVFVGMTALYLFINLFFGGLYMLEPGSVANAEEQSFLDAFFFSVQTMSTIGYGTMSPGSVTGDLIVTVEAAVGLFFAALATGLMFAKASRPKASVLFSRPVLVTEMNGKRVMTFRVGNARGNEVVDASISVTVAKDELTDEGHHIRRLSDLALQRSRSPLFMLSWSVFHEVDESSPLFDCIDGVVVDDQRLSAVIITLTGHDGTYGQTVFARHTYYPEDFRIGHRFVDIFSQLEDGRLMIDYTKFHDTILDDEAIRQLA